MRQNNGQDRDRSDKGRARGRQPPARQGRHNHTKEEVITATLNGTRRRARKQERPPELPAQQAPQGEKLAKPATATPNPEGPPALLASKPGHMKFWVMTDSESYLLRKVPRRNGDDVGGWSMTKYSDGTQFHIADSPQGLVCDCPGCTSHGPQGAGGKGCKHMRMIRALISLMLEG